MKQPYRMRHESGEARRETIAQPEGGRADVDGDDGEGHGWR